MEAEREKEAVEPGQRGGTSPALTLCLHGDGEKRLLGNLFRRQLTGSAVWVNGVEEKGKAGMACRFSGLGAGRMANLKVATSGEGTDRKKQVPSG